MSLVRVNSKQARILLDIRSIREHLEGNSPFPIYDDTRSFFEENLRDKLKLLPKNVKDSWLPVMVDQSFAELRAKLEDPSHAA